MPSPTAPELKLLAVYTSAETARELRVSPRHLRKLVHAGKLAPLPYCTGKHLFAGHELARFIGAAS